MLISKHHPLFLIMIATCSVALGQNKLLDSAFNSFHQGNYSKAVDLYKQVVAKDHYDFEMLLLGLCYEKMDSIPQAKQLFEQTIEHKSTFKDAACDASRELADLYYKEKNYRKAIDYYRKNGEIWEHARFADVNKFAFEFQKAVNISNCFKSLGEIDSAIAQPLPYIFSNFLMLKGYVFRFGPEKSDLPDSLHCDSVCRSYLMLLKERYTVRRIKRELKKADANFEFKERNHLFGKDSIYVERTAQIGFAFLGVPIKRDGFGVLLNQGEATPTKYGRYFTREYYLTQFRQMPLYKMIEAL